MTGLQFYRHVYVTYNISFIRIETRNTHNTSNVIQVQEQDEVSHSDSEILHAVIIISSLRVTCPSLGIYTFYLRVYTSVFFFFLYPCSYLNVDNNRDPPRVPRMCFSYIVCVSHESLRI